MTKENNVVNEITELKQRICTKGLGNSRAEVSSGKLSSPSGETVNYSVTLGWDLVASKECDDYWTHHNIQLLEFIEAQNYSEDELKRVLDSIQTEDFHWDWCSKSLAYRTVEYKWFYLYANNEPQAACVIYQPKISAVQNGNIFYVEFVAVAPWNRKCAIRERKYYGVGTKILKAALEYAVNQLGLLPGFSLHSLPQAQAYYKKLKMENIKLHDKDNLLYFELPNKEASELLEAL